MSINNTVTLNHTFLIKAECLIPNFEIRLDALMTEYIFN